MCPTFAIAPATASAIAPTAVLFTALATVPKMPGPTSKASRALADVRLQLKAGTTRKGSALELEEISALEEKRGRMVAEMRAKRQKKSSAASRTMRLLRRAT